MIDAIIPHHLLDQVVSSHAFCLCLPPPCHLRIKRSMSNTTLTPHLLTQHLSTRYQIADDISASFSLNLVGKSVRLWCAISMREAI